MLLRGGAALPELPGSTSFVAFALYLGTTCGALSGTISAGTKQMDLLGCVVVGMISAIGGGTLRDMILGRPPFWLTSSAHLHLSIWFSVFTFLCWPLVTRTGFKDTHLAFLWTDAVGMGASCVYGAHVGLKETGEWAVAVMMGVVTAIGSGILRDLLILEPPRALYADRSMYATPALLGAAGYVALYLLSGTADAPDEELPQWLMGGIPFVLAVCTRAAAWTYRLALPRWARKTNYFGPVKLGDSIEIELMPAKHGNDNKPKA